MKFKVLLATIIFAISTTAFSKNNLIGFEIAKTIKAGSHTIEENVRHRKICQQQGAIDVTDSTDIQLARNTTDAVICSLPYPITLGATLFPLDPLNASSLSTNAPNGTINFGPYLIRGYAYFSNARVGSSLLLGTGVLADHCGSAGAIAINVSTGSSYIEASCSYPSSRGSRQSYTEAKLEGLYNKSYGIVNLR